MWPTFANREILYARMEAAGSGTADASRRSSTVASRLTQWAAWQQRESAQTAGGLGDGRDVGLRKNRRRRRARLRGRRRHRRGRATVLETGRPWWSGRRRRRAWDAVSGTVRTGRTRSSGSWRRGDGDDGEVRPRAGVRWQQWQQPRRRSIDDDEEKETARRLGGAGGGDDGGLRRARGCGTAARRRRRRRDARKSPCACIPVPSDGRGFRWLG